MSLRERGRVRTAALGLLLLGVALILFDTWRWWRWRHPVDQGGYPRADLSAPHRGDTHLSGYAYRDRDRDGRYDRDDEPMAGVAIELTDARGRRSMERSNLTGFANFEMSRSKWGAAIRRPGEYTFSVEVPPGWILTSGNAVQKTRIEPLPGAPGDLVSRNPPGPLGLAPVLEMAGRCLARRADGALAGAADASVAADGPGGRHEAIRVAADGAFRIAVEPGEWRLTCARPGSPSVEREISVRDAPVFVAGLVLGEPRPERLGSPAGVDFEAITGSPVRKVPAGVAGLDWTYLNAIEAVWAEGQGYVNTLTSGHYVGYSSSGHPVTLARAGGFDLRGGYFGIAHREAEGDLLRVRAFRGDAVVADDEVVLSSLGPVWLDADFRAVDRVELSTRHYWQFAVDDLSVSTPAESGASSSTFSSAGSPSARASAPPRP